MLDITPQWVGNRGLAALRDVIAEPGRYAIEPKVDGVRGLVAFLPGGLIETRDRNGIRRDWLRGDGFETGLRRLAVREGLVLKDRGSIYRDGSRVGWVKVKDEGWYAREPWRFQRRDDAS